MFGLEDITTENNTWIMPKIQDSTLKKSYNKVLKYTDDMQIEKDSSESVLSKIDFIFKYVNLLSIGTSVISLLLLLISIVIGFQTSTWIWAYLSFGGSVISLPLFFISKKILKFLDYKINNQIKLEKFVSNNEDDVNAQFLLNNYYNKKYLSFKNNNCNLSYDDFSGFIELLRTIKDKNNDVLSNQVNQYLYECQKFGVKIGTEEYKKIINLSESFYNFESNIDSIMGYKEKLIPLVNNVNKIISDMGVDNQINIYNEFYQEIDSYSQYNNYYDIMNFNKKLEDFKNNKDNIVNKLNEIIYIKNIINEVENHVDAKTKKDMLSEFKYILGILNDLDVEYVQKFKNKLFVLHNSI